MEIRGGCVFGRGTESGGRGQPAGWKGVSGSAVRPVRVLAAALPAAAGRFRVYDPSRPVRHCRVFERGFVRPEYLAMGLAFLPDLS